MAAGGKRSEGGGAEKQRGGASSLLIGRLGGGGSAGGVASAASPCGFRKETFFLLFSALFKSVRDWLSVRWPTNQLSIHLGRTLSSFVALFAITRHSSRVTTSSRPKDFLSIVFFFVIYVCRNVPRSARVLGGELHALLLLALVAEPDAHHVLLQVEFLGDGGDLLARRPRLPAKRRKEKRQFLKTTTINTNTQLIKAVVYPIYLTSYLPRELKTKSCIKSSASTHW